MNKGCLTCKERKISCDKAFPVCHKCVKSQRACRPYQERLSWPGKNDSKRAVLSHTKSITHAKGAFLKVNFINTSARDIQIHGKWLSENTTHIHVAQYEYMSVLLPTTPPLNYINLEYDSVELIPYFFALVLPSLPAFGIDLDNLHDTITRLAFSDESHSSQAVQNSLLALAALHRSGTPKQATRFIAAALSSLSISVQKGIGPRQSLQHILAGILICSFELHLFSQSSYAWLVYLFGTKAIINRFYQHESFKEKDAALLFQLVFYYDTIARLGMKHGRGYDHLKSQLYSELGMNKRKLQYANEEITRFSSHGQDAVRVLSDFCTGVLPPEDPNYHSEEYISWLSGIERRLYCIREDLQQQNASSTDYGNQSESLAVKELFVLATLLYVERKSTQLAGLSSKSNAWITDGFAILSKIKYCNKPFPLFAFGQGQESDTKRRLILEIIDRTSQMLNHNGLEMLKEILIKSWIQHDLDNEEDKIQKTSSCAIMIGWK